MIDGIVRGVVMRVKRRYPYMNVDDLMSLAWVKTMESIEFYDESKSKMSTYIYKVLYGYLCKESMKTFVKEEPLEELEDNISSPSIERTIEARDIIEKIYKESKGLRRKIISRMLKGKSQREIAKELNIQKKDVDWELRKLRSEFKEKKT